MSSRKANSNPGRAAKSPIQSKPSQLDFPRRESPALKFQRNRPANNRAMTACCSAAIGSLVPVALYQCGITHSLTDPHFRIFRSRKIVTSPGAYPFGIPDALLGIASYGTTLALMCNSRPIRSAAPTLCRRALQAKLAIDGTLATVNVVRQIGRHKRLCSWCMGAALATAGMIYFARKS